MTTRLRPNRKRPPRLLNVDENTLIVEALQSKGTKVTLPKHVLRRLLHNYHAEIDKGHDERRVRRLLLCCMAASSDGRHLDDFPLMLEQLQRFFQKSLPVSYLMNQWQAAKKLVKESQELGKRLLSECTPRERAMLNQGRIPRRFRPIFETWTKQS